MKKTWPVIVALVMLSTGCGRDAEERAVEEASEEAAARAGAAARGAPAGGRNVEPVDVGTLRDLLPASLDGHTRRNVDGNRDGAMGFYVSTATAEYHGDGTVEIAIVDLGGIADPSMMGYAWAEEEMDRGTAEGYERTVTFEGYKAHQKYDERTRQGEMAVLVADRFIVAVEGEGVAMNTIKDALSRIDLDRLEAMRTAGAQPAD